MIVRCYCGCINGIPSLEGFNSDIIGVSSTLRGIQSHIFYLLNGSLFSKKMLFSQACLFLMP